MMFCIDSLQSWALLQEVCTHFRLAARAPIVLSHLTLKPARPSVILRAVGVRHASLESTQWGDSIAIKAYFPIDFYFQNLPVNLKTLRVRWQFISSLTGVEHLSRLTTLEFQSCIFTRLERLPCLPNLRILILNGYEQFARFGIKLPRFTELPRLEVLAVTWSNLSDHHLRDLIVLEELHTLILQECLITDLGIALLSHLPSLRTLNVCSSLIRSAALGFIPKFPSLQILDLSGCDNIAPPAVHNLRLLKPNLNVIFKFPMPFF
jgi:Leucine-rich repeat (LRR) protein